ncbi:MAG: hypothetical protein ABSF29_15700 [Tepidisphaeraceae bacterium]
MNPPEKTGRRDGLHLLFLLALLAAVRLFWMFIVMPPQSISIDMLDWRTVAYSLHHGINPYEKFELLNWPPFWMECIRLLFKISTSTNISFDNCVRFFLILADMTLLTSLWWLLKILDTTAPITKLLLWGYCLNPLLTILTVQHGNFDACAMIWVVLSIGWIIKFRRSDDQLDWLIAAAFLGMGIFTKTFPLFLTPLLAQGSRKLPARTRVLGVGILVGPAALALAPLFALTPSPIAQHVIGYRSMGDSFGVLSLLSLAGLHPNQFLYEKIFGLFMLCALCTLALYLIRTNWPHDRNLPLLAALIFLFVFTLGTGYGSQYWFWVFPLILIAYPRQPPWFRSLLTTAAAIIIATNLYEYAVERWLGGFWYWRNPSQQMNNLNLRLMFSPTATPLLQLPMTLAALAVLIAGLRVLNKSAINEK